ncbi:alpha/beta fold hydrolase [uncultured Sphaerochaeta sp.]|uniref:alpha/beta hydrolase family protein n=1 Tax=uncultured Sphaerochaeta sp. TaxID=886478 RepID=UPI002A0A4147|nr:alpha/beta fold hydrolase [uncultured Sphaerochaeta sp.]
MKRLFGISILVMFSLVLFLSSCASSKQMDSLVKEDPMVPKKTTLDISGWWEGSLSLPGGSSLLLQFEVETAQEGYSSFLTVRQQGVHDLPVSTTSFDQSSNSFSLNIETIKATFAGNLDTATDPYSIVGTFSQSGLDFPLVLEKKFTALIRPQDVSAPFPYISEDVEIPTANGFSLAGTITRPKDEGVHPAVILVTGSGLQDRNEELFGHKPFLVLADALTKAGIVVLRCDDRGYGKSGGDGINATTFDFAQDAKAALSYLATMPYTEKDVLGVIGHSEGALIAGILSAQDPAISFIVLLSGPGLDGKDLLLQQSRAIMQRQGLGQDQIDAAVALNKTLYDIALDTATSQEDRAKEIQSILVKNGMSEKVALQQSESLLSAWFNMFLAIDPADYFSKITCPVLIVSGTNDVQVPTEGNVKALQDALAVNGNTHVTVKILEGLNHMLQPSVSGLPTEYESIETTLDPSVLSLVPTWIHSLKH